tara:strand:- start:122 stop:775 length:654 start_codon:yes stop_codon:yes gene_type:complete
MIALLLAGTPALALAQDTTCRGGLFTRDGDFAQAQVITARAFFHEDVDGCPASGDCRKRSFVIAGDQLVIDGRRIGGFVCAFYPNDSGGTAGWIEASRLRMMASDAAPPRQRWEGAWTDGASADVQIASTGSATIITGNAFWPARPEENEWISIHIGEVGGALSIAGNRATYGDDNLCELELTLLRDFLLIADNRQCGGANVTFSGVYTRANQRDRS